MLFLALIAFLNSQDIWHLSQVINCDGAIFSDDYWFSVVDLELPGDLAEEWSCFILAINTAGIRLTEDPDSLVWSFNKLNGMVTTKEAYSYIT